MVYVVPREVLRPKPKAPPRGFWLRESIGHYTGLGQRILEEVNPNILVQDAIRMKGKVGISDDITR